MGVDQAELDTLMFQQDLAVHGHHQYQQGYNKHVHDKGYRSRYSGIFIVLLSWPR